MPRVDTVFHLAATVGVLNIIARPVATINNNVGTTSAVFAGGGRTERRRSSSPRPRKSMARAARDGLPRGWRPGSGADQQVPLELRGQQDRRRVLALAFWQEYGLPAVVVRLFNTIGPRQTGRYGMVVPRFLGRSGERTSPSSAMAADRAVHLRCGRGRMACSPGRPRPRGRPRIQPDSPNGHGHPSCPTGVIDSTGAEGGR